MIPVAAIIVTHQSAEVAGAAVQSCLDAGAAEVVVVDNASSDGTAGRIAAAFPQVKLLAEAENHGFAGGVNRGAAASAAPYLLLLNPDAVLRAGLAEMVAVCAQPGVGVVGGRLEGHDGGFQRGFAYRRLPTAASLALEVLGIHRLWPGNPVNRRYRCLDANPLAAADVEQPAGAFLLTRRDVFEEFGGFDERFHPVWFEDVDYCRRVLAAGYRIRYEPAAIARHHGGHSASQLDWGRREHYWYASLLLYAAKHLSRAGRIVVVVSVVAGCVLRALIQSVRHAGSEPVRVYAKVIRLALGSLR